MGDLVPPAEKQSKQVADEKRPSARPGLRIVGIVLIVVSVLTAWFLLVGYFAWRQGQEDLAQKQESALMEQLTQQLDLAAADIAEGKYDLANRRLTWVLERDPANDSAQALLVTAAAAQVTPQVTAVVATPLTATPTPEPSPTPAPLGSPEAELQRIRRLIVAKSWVEVLDAVVRFQEQYPSYERQETNQMLYDAYIRLGIEELNGPQVEMGLYYLEQAEKLGDLTQEALDYRTWAQLYLQGISFYGVNWDVSAYYFRDLCLAAPFYQNACDRLFQALIAFGDQYAGSLDWCQAQVLYEEALRYGRDQALTNKRNQAADECLLATPTPAGAITETVPFTDTLPPNNFLFEIPVTITPAPYPVP